MDYQNEQDQQEITKEIPTLNDLREKAIDTLELEVIQDMDENMEESVEAFEQIVEEKSEETLSEETESKLQKEEEKKKKTFKEKINLFKEKWMALPKKKRIIILSVSTLILILLIVGIVFLVTRHKEEETNIPDVIVELDNYRYQNGKLIFLDEKEKEIGEYTCKNQDQDLCYVAYYSKEDAFDEPKYIYEDGEKIDCRSKLELNQYAFVYDNKEKEDGMITLYDFLEQKEIDTYTLVKGYDKLSQQVILKDKSGKYGLYRLMEDKVEPVLESTYDYLGVIENNKEEINKLVMKDNGKWYLISMDGTVLTKAISNEIRDFNDQHIKVIDGSGNYHLVDYDNNEVKTDSYDYIDLLDTYYLLVQDGKLYVTDTEIHPMNLDGIPLSNSNYLITSTYSKDNKLIKTEKSYEVAFQGNLMVIKCFQENNLDSEEYRINFNEGKMSASLSFLNYFDGKLYIYKDAEKKTLLGSYPCENKNSVSDENSGLTNCKMAIESFYQDNDVEANQENNLGVLPIYNERFAFISDGSTINLYDLKEGSVKAKYRSVDAGAYTKTNDVNFVTANNTHIIAENTSGKYGIIKINYNAVEGVKGFDYNHIERIQFHYIVQDSSGYALMDHDGNVITDTATNKIRNFSNDYVVRSNGSKYYLYPYHGENLTPSGYDYISLYDRYYGAVLNKELNFYAYDEKKAILEKGISLQRSNYYGSGTLAYVVTISGTTATVKVGGTDDQYHTETVSLKPKTTTPSATPGLSFEDEQNE